MVEVGEHPILWHIMKLYSHFGVNDFIICLGYKGYVIKEYFANYLLHSADVTFDIARNNMTIHQNTAEPWRVTLVDTGQDTMTGGRLKAVGRYLEGESEFCFTYGDGVGDIDVARQIRFHRNHGKLATMTVSRPPGRFGEVILSGRDVRAFSEKGDNHNAWVNAGYFVLSPQVLDYIDGPSTTWEQEPLARLVEEGQLCAYPHDGFWHPMDTVRDRNHLVGLWSRGEAPWKLWDNPCRAGAEQPLVAESLLI